MNHELLCYCAWLFFLMSMLCLCEALRKRIWEVESGVKKELALKNTQKYVRKRCVNRTTGNACDYF